MNSAYILGLSFWVIQLFIGILSTVKSLSYQETHFSKLCKYDSFAKVVYHRFINKKVIISFS